jgi:hypothetical protein
MKRFFLDFLELEFVLSQSVEQSPSQNRCLCDDPTGSRLGDDARFIVSKKLDRIA